MKNLVKYAKQSWKSILLILFFLVIQAYCELSLPTYTARLVDTGIGENGIYGSNYQMNYLYKIAFLMILISLIDIIAAIFVGYIASRIGAKTSRNLRNNLFKKVVGFSNSELDKFSTASLITRNTNDVQQIQMVLVMMLRIILYAPILGIGGIIKVSQTKASLSWIIMVAIAIIICLVTFLFAVAMPKFKMMQVLVDRVNLVAREMLTGIPVIRAFTTEKHEEKRFDKANMELANTQLYTNRVMAFMMPMMMLLMNLVSIGILWFGGKEIDNGNLQVGEMMAFLTYAMQIIMSFLMITMVSIILPRAGVAADRIEEVLKTEITIKSKGQTEPVGNIGEITFDHVFFKYSDAEDYMIKDATFTAKNGETTALIGSTGSGKSTLINLIPRFFDVSKGRIVIDGIDIRDMKLEELRQMLGYVPQKGILFSGTIESNIKFSSPNISKERVEKAAQIAQSVDFIMEKKDQYESVISQGGNNVSGGQKQRLSIARAIAKTPKIYIFDDSFSALDFKTEVELRRALQEETRKSTVLIVAQRITTIINAEKIVVLENGRIVGCGIHEELMEQCEVYQQIANSQLSQQEIEHSLVKKEGIVHE